MENSQSAAPPSSESAVVPAASKGQKQIGPPDRGPRENPWLVFLLPLVVFMLVGSFEPTKPADAGNGSSAWIDLGIAYRHYPFIYSIKILLTAAAMCYVLPGYGQVLCQSDSPSLDSGGKDGSGPGNERRWVRASVVLALVIGIVGTVAWVGLALLQKAIIQQLGWSFGLGVRSAFNPLVELAATPIWAYGFLAIRFFGLVVVVPVTEEMFLRGFLMRYCVAPEWWRVPVGNVNTLAIVAATVVPMLMHPSELAAAAVWFSAVTWLLVRTRNIWPCILAHAVTNLLMGVYVLMNGNWWLM